ncbi:MAG: hypothetical protein GYB67_10795 [Chloroflexi bacterium]|nr:hypothetical protein [Chloroflexota bacterium]
MSFAYTLSEIEPRNQRLLLVALGVFALILLLWVIWFLFVPATIYETTPTATINPNGTITALVDETLLPLLRIGQPALFNVTVAGGAFRQYNARVSEVDQAAGTAELLLNITNADSQGLFDGLQGEIAFELRQVTPVQLVLEAIGQTSIGR